MVGVEVRQEDEVDPGEHAVAERKETLRRAAPGVHEDAHRSGLDEDRRPETRHRRPRVASPKERDADRGRWRRAGGKTKRGEQREKDRRPPRVHARSLDGQPAPAIPAVFGRGKRLPLKKSRLSCAMNSWRISFGQAREHSPWFVHVPKPSASICPTIESTRS